MIDGDELDLYRSKAFKDVDKANEYFKKVLKEEFADHVKDWTDDDFDGCLDDGYYMDDTHYCLYINSFTLEE